ncbi:MAG: hypothetical protein KGJ12_01810 [Gammaproteobacteria bacterium]|nr:hypothetical protein [Gammaproteobacteria bacterium]
MTQYRRHTVGEIFGVSPARSWVSYLIMVPAALAAVLLAMFFFAAFLAVFALAALVFSVRLWWLRRKLRKAADGHTLEGEYTVVEEEPARRIEDAKREP